MSLGDYEELRYLGCGGFGSVSLVRCKKDGQQVRRLLTIAVDVAGI